MEVDVKESETMKVKLKDIGQTTIEGQRLLFELRIIPSNFPIELWLEFLLWDSLGPLRGSQRVQKGSQRVPGGPREFGEDPSRPKIEKKCSSSNENRF